MQPQTKKFWVYSAVGGVCAFSTQCTLRADMITLTPVQDATLLGGTDTGNSMANPGIFVGTDGEGNPKRGLIEFDLSPSDSRIPAGSTITGAELQLDLGNVAGAGGGSGTVTASETVGIYDETQPWGKVATNVSNTASLGMNGHGKPAKSGDVTWNYAYYNTTPWNSGTNAGNWTTNSATLASITVATNLGHYDWSSASMVADVQNWLNNPTSNNGWIIVNGDEVDDGTYRAFYSEEGSISNSNSAYAPQLILTYTPAPEPSTLGLLTLGLPILMRRRCNRSEKAS